MLFALVKRVYITKTIDRPAICVFDYWTIEELTQQVFQPHLQHLYLPPVIYLRLLISSVWEFVWMANGRHMTCLVERVWRYARVRFDALLRWSRLCNKNNKDSYTDKVSYIFIEASPVQQQSATYSRDKWRMRTRFSGSHSGAGGGNAVG